MRLIAIISLISLFYVECTLGDGKDLHCPFPFDGMAKPVMVDLELRIFALAEFHDVFGSLIIKASLVSAWNDSCGWKLAQKLFPKKTETNTIVYIDSDHFWIPLMSQDNSDGARAYDDTGYMPIEVYESGLLRFYGRKSWLATCKGQFSKFPFDVHICRLDYLSWFNTNFVRFSKVTLEFGINSVYNSDGLALFYADYSPPLHFQSTYSCANRTCSIDRANFTVILKRKWFPYYIFGVFLPLISLSILQLTSFFMPYSDVDRITFSGTIFVANALITRAIRSYIPQTSEHIIIMTTSSLASIGSLFSTIFYIFSFAMKTEVKENVMKRMEKIAISLFSVFSILLYLITIVCIAF